MENPTSANRPSFINDPASTTDVKGRFHRYFQQEVADLQEEIVNLEKFSPIERKDATDHCLAGIGRLNSDVMDATDFLPAYDQRTYAQAIKALNERLQETRAKFAPKSRFQFKTTQKSDSAGLNSDAAGIVADKRLQSVDLKSNPSSSSYESSVATNAAIGTPSNEADALGDLPSFPSKNYNEEMSRNASASIRKPSFSQATNISISGHSGLHIILPSTASRATSSGSVTMLEKCIVDMSVPTATAGTPFAGLALKSIKHSLIIVGHVEGAAHITGVEDSIIVVTSRQVRMHDCKNVDIYLHCASRPIIEDCSNVRFSPIPKCYTLKAIDAVENQWDQVDDFKWLKAEHSPNWSILPEEQRLAEEIWTETVPGGHGAGLHDVLRAVGL